MVEDSGTRSALYWEVDRLLGDFRPAWVVLENVPGLLSSRGGRDMGAVLGSLAQRGYGFAYRVLDARYFGVPQRRRRVVIVGRLGDDGRAPAQVLLEPEGVRGDPAQGIAPRSRAASTSRCGPAIGGLIAPRFAATLTAGVSSPGVSAPGRRQEDDYNIVAFDPKAGGDRTSSGAFEDGTGITPTVGGARAHAIAYVAAHTTALDTAQGGPDDNTAQGGQLVATTGIEGITVRRLTPREHERLQGFPDGHTATSAGKPQADSPRYKQLGNAVAVPVFEWVSRRIVAVDAASMTKAVAS
jgi:DNA (cytosine-5)-methyltransferase 1